MHKISKIIPKTLWQVIILGAFAIAAIILLYPTKDSVPASAQSCPPPITCNTTNTFWCGDDDTVLGTWQTTVKGPPDTGCPLGRYTYSNYSRVNRQTKYCVQAYGSFNGCPNTTCSNKIVSTTNSCVVRYNYGGTSCTPDAFGFDPGCTTPPPGGIGSPLPGGGGGSLPPPVIPGPSIQVSLCSGQATCPASADAGSNVDLNYVVNFTNGAIAEASCTFSNSGTSFIVHATDDGKVLTQTVVPIIFPATYELNCTYNGVSDSANYTLLGNLRGILIVPPFAAINSAVPVQITAQSGSTPVSNVTINLLSFIQSLTSNTCGILSPSSVLSNSIGQAYSTFTAPANPTTCDIEAKLSKNGYVPTSVLAPIQIVTSTPTPTPTPTPNPTLDVILSANPSSGFAPLNTLISALVTGTAVGTINYTFWWNCNNPDTNISNVMADPSCGSIPTPSAGQCSVNSNGFKCDGASAQNCSITGVSSAVASYTCTAGSPAMQNIPHVYQNAGTFNLKTIVERSTSAATRSTLITANPASSTSTPTPTPTPTPLSCIINPSSQIALTGQSKTFQVSSASGAGPFTWSIVSGDASTCTLTPNTNGTSVTVSCTTSGQRSLQCFASGQGGVGSGGGASSPTSTFTVFGEKVIEK